PSAGRKAKSSATKSGAAKNRRRRSGNVGDSRKAAAAFGGKGDFGAPEQDVRERNYASTAARNQDPGGIAGHSTGTGTRDTGVGGNASGTGSSSGGDVDTDIIGVGQGGTTDASAGPDDRDQGPDLVIGGQNPSDTSAAPS